MGSANQPDIQVMITIFSSGSAATIDILTDSRTQSVRLSSPLDSAHECQFVLRHSLPLGALGGRNFKWPASTANFPMRGWPGGNS